MNSSKTLTLNKDLFKREISPIKLLPLNDISNDVNFVMGFLTGFENNPQINLDLFQCITHMQDYEDVFDALKKDLSQINIDTITDAVNQIDKLYHLVIQTTTVDCVPFDADLQKVKSDLEVVLKELIHSLSNTVIEDNILNNFKNLVEDSKNFKDALKTEQYDVAGQSLGDALRLTFITTPTPTPS